MTLAILYTLWSQPTYLLLALAPLSLYALFNTTASRFSRWYTLVFLALVTLQVLIRESLLCLMRVKSSLIKSQAVTFSFNIVNGNNWTIESLLNIRNINDGGAADFLFIVSAAFFAGLINRKADIPQEDLDSTRKSIMGGGSPIRRSMMDDDLLTIIPDDNIVRSSEKIFRKPIGQNILLNESTRIDLLQQ